MSDFTQAFGISVDDVENVINSARRWGKTILPARAALAALRSDLSASPPVPSISLESLAAAIFDRLDHDAVARCALDGGTEMDDQTTAAYEEIERQINEMDPRILTLGYPPASSSTPDASNRLVPPQLLTQLAEQVCIFFGQPAADAVQAERVLRAVAGAFAASAEGRQVISDQDVEAGYKSQAQLERAFSGEHQVAAGFEDAPFPGCPDTWGEKTFAKIVWHEDKGDPSVGMPGTAGWTLGPDQKDTVVADLARGAEQVQAMRSALSGAESFISGFEDDETQEGIDALLAEIRSAQAPSGVVPVAQLGQGRLKSINEAVIALYDVMDRSGLLTGEGIPELFTLRREVALDSGLPDAAESAAFWQDKLDALAESPDRRTRGDLYSN